MGQLGDMMKEMMSGNGGNMMQEMLNNPGALQEVCASQG